MTLMVLFFEICYYFALSVFKLLQKNKKKKFCSFQKDIFYFYCKWPVRLLWNTVKHKFHKAIFPLATAPVLDDSTVSQLCEMGFPLEACRKAVYYTGNTGIDSAMNWIMTHMEDSGVQNSAKLTGKKENTLPVRLAQPSRSSSL